MIPYGRQCLDENDIQAVVEVLRSDWLTTGPKVIEFEKAFADLVGAKEAVAVSSGTAALHAAMYALDIKPGDEVIVPAMTFVATANCVVFQGGKPVFADVDPETLLVDPEEVEKKITSTTRAVIGVDYAGQPCDYDILRDIAKRHNLALVDDACHALGATYNGSPVGSLADLNTFSFHPVKHVTTGEGGMVTTDDSELAKGMRSFRNHGITSDHHQRELQGSWHYEMVDLGFNYRLTDIQCALGLSQLKKLSEYIELRNQIAKKYDQAFVEIGEVEPLRVSDAVKHAYHLYVVRLSKNLDRSEVFRNLRKMGIGVNVHYMPVHLHPYYRTLFGFGFGLCPNAEETYERILSLPIFPSMSDKDVESVIESVRKVVREGAGD
ncbi:MAG: UDP-4-amino-4,6-dideoxy-N-acetyl-beta-L-altrosamine transaminase [Deltaproteobacteria bacterium]